MAQKSDNQPPHPNDPHIVREEFRRKVMQTIDSSQLPPNPPSVQPVGSASKTSSGNNDHPSQNSDTDPLSPTEAKPSSFSDTLKARSFESGSLDTNTGSNQVSSKGKPHLLPSNPAIEPPLLSPSSVEDEHMKQIEKVGVSVCDLIFVVRLVFCRYVFSGGRSSSVDRGGRHAYP